MDEKDLLIAQLRKENAALRQMIEDLQKQVKNLTEAVLLLRKNRFGSKSERTRNLLEEDGQLNLFNEIELEGDPEKKVSVNGSEIQAVEGVYSFVVSADAEVSVEFERE